MVSTAETRVDLTGVAFQKKLPPYLERKQTRDYGVEKITFYHLVSWLAEKLALQPGTFAVLGVGRGLESLVMGYGLAAAGNPSPVFNLDNSWPVLTELKSRATDQGWPNQLFVMAEAEPSVVRPRKGHETRLSGLPVRNVSLFDTSSLLHEIRGDPSHKFRVCQAVWDSLAPFGVWVLREFEPWPPGIVRLGLKTPEARDFYTKFIKAFPWTEEKRVPQLKLNSVDLDSLAAAEIIRHFHNWHRVHRKPAEMKDWSEIKEHYFWITPERPDPEQEMADYMAEEIIEHLSQASLADNDCKPVALTETENLGDELLNKHFSFATIDPNSGWIQEYSYLPPNKRVWIIFQKIPKVGNAVNPAPWHDEMDLKSIIARFRAHLEVGQQPPEILVGLHERLSQCKQLFLGVDQVLAFSDPNYYKQLAIATLPHRNLRKAAMAVADDLGQFSKAAIETLSRHLTLDRGDYRQRIDEQIVSDTSARLRVPALFPDVKELKKLTDRGIQLHIVSEEPLMFLGKIRDMLKKIGIPVASIVSQEDLLREWPADSTVPHPRFPHPALYRVAAKKIVEAGQQWKIDPNGVRKNGGSSVETPDSLLRQTAIVVSRTHQVGASQTLGLPVTVLMRRPADQKKIGIYDLPLGPWISFSDLNQLVAAVNGEAPHPI